MARFLAVVLALTAVPAFAGEGSAYNNKCDIDQILVGDSHSGSVTLVYDTYGCEDYAGSVILELVGTSVANKTRLWVLRSTPSANNATYTFTGVRDGAYTVNMYVYQSGESRPAKGDEDYVTLDTHPLHVTHRP